jgi:NADH-quinone oxidoreductase subunit I
MYGLAMVKGLMVTLKNLTKKPFTIQYPEERARQHPRFRGEEFVWYEERCTGCASCAKYCPLGIIKIETSPSGSALPQGDKYRLEVFDIELQRCMFCGLCVEACPYDALFMGSGFEQGQYSRKNMVITIDQLRNAEKHPSAWFRPQLEGYEGEASVRRGTPSIAQGDSRFTYDPRGGPPLGWREVGREAWRWHQKEKAGMRFDESPEIPDTAGSPATEQSADD